MTVDEREALFAAGKLATAVELVLNASVFTMTARAEMMRDALVDYNKTIYAMWRTPLTASGHTAAQCDQLAETIRRA
ncbi:hypothetical protein M0R72_12545 [Candidatus Pacearchaeota archaeon]|jgi:hypothetical protein|nr:hypothetical protein [Candidatus Pacearchaeota archaeon]